MPTSLPDTISILGTANAVSFGPLQAGAIAQFLTGGLLGQPVGNAGMQLAASGGRLTKGILMWTTDNGATKTLVFQMNPDAINDKSSPKYATHEVPGQNRPLMHFINGGRRVLSFTLHFFSADRNRETIRNSLEQLRQLAQRPNTTFGDSGARSGPPILFFYFGKTYEGFRCVLTACPIKMFDLFDPVTLLPLQASAEVELTEAFDPTDQIRLVPSSGSQHDLLGSFRAAF